MFLLHEIKKKRSYKILYFKGQAEFVKENIFGNDSY